jgi:cell division protease FtsH
MMGAERRSMVMSEDEKKLTAYHESGHAIVGRLMPDHDPVYKVTIIPRGQALGVTMFLPEEDQHSYSRRKLESKLASAYGGRVAEELYLGTDLITTGASSDIDYATKMARNMVQRWGLSELGPIAFSEQEEEVFLGRSITQNKHMSEDTARKIDIEVQRILDLAYKRATQVLKENRPKLEMMAAALIKYETIDSGQIDSIMDGQEPGPPNDWWDSPDDAGGDDSHGKNTDDKAGDTGIGEPAESH